MPNSSRIKLFKRSNGVYYLIVTEGGISKYRSTRCKLKSQALDTLTELRKTLTEKPKYPLLSAFIDDFLKFAAGNYSRGTVGIYRSTLKRFLALCGNMCLDNITGQHLDNYKAERLKTIGPVTINLELRALRAAFNVAKRWRMLDGNPFEGVKLISIPEAQPSFFSRDDFERLLAVVKEQWLKEIIILAVLTGMRRGEIVNLKWSDVDLVRRVVTIISTETFKTKFGKRRMIPLSDVAYNLLIVRHKRSAEEYVFTLNGTRIREGWVSHKFKYYVYEAKLSNDKLHFHSLRHTFASWLVQDGVSIYEVQKLLGHSNILVTQIYSHLQPEKLHNTVNRILLPMN